MLKSEIRPSVLPRISLDMSSNFLCILVALRLFDDAGIGASGPEIPEALLSTLESRLFAQAQPHKNTDRDTGQNNDKKLK